MGARLDLSIQIAERLPLATPELVIEQFSEVHLTSRYVSWLNDPTIVEYSEQRFKRHTIESCRAYMQSFDGTPNFFLAITTSDEEPTHIGTMSVYIDEHNGLADMAMLIGERSKLGRGYGTRAWVAMCDLLFDAGVRKVTGGTTEVNESALRMMERSGMVREGRLRSHHVIAGRPVDVILLGLFREDRAFL